MEPAPTASASHRPSSTTIYAGGLSRSKRKELQHLFEQALVWLEQTPPNFHQALTGLGLCMKTDPLAAVYTFEFLQTIESAVAAGDLHFNWFQRRKNRKLIREIEKLCQKQNWSAVFQKAPAAIYHNPRHPKLLHLLATACQATDGQDGARTYCQFALTADPSHAETHRQVLENYLCTGQFDDAKEHWLELLIDTRVTPLNLSKIHASLPQTLQDTLPSKDLADEIELFRRQLARSQQDETVWKHLGDLYSENQLFCLAVECSQAASQALGHSGQGDQKIALLRKQQAETRLQFHINHSDDGLLMEELTEELLRVRTEFYQARCKAEPGNVSNQIHLGWCLLETNNPFEAVKIFAQIKHANLPPALSLIARLGQGETEQLLRQFDCALSTFQQAVKSITLTQLSLLTSASDAVDIPTLDTICLTKRILNRTKTLAQAMDAVEIAEDCDLLAEKTGISLDN